MAVAETTLPAPLAQALRQSRGARFYRMALQVNPFDYLVRHNKATPYATEAEYNDAIVAACREHGVHAIAVTDHFRIASSDGLTAAAKDAGIAAFPGFEAVSKEGVHLLCLFDPVRPHREIERIIGECGIHKDHTASPVGKLDVEELLGRAKDWDAVFVAAHATQPGGLLRKLSGQTRVRAWRSPNLQAIAIPGPVGDLPQDLRTIVRCEGDYAREQPIAVVNAGDVL